MPARFADSSSLLRGRRLACRRPRDRENLAHVLGERFAKVLGIGRHRTPLVPLNGISLSNRLAPVCYANDSQSETIGSQQRRNDRYPLPRFGERQQGVRRARAEYWVGHPRAGRRRQTAFELNIESATAADRNKPADINRSGMSAGDMAQGPKPHPMVQVVSKRRRLDRV